LCNDSKNIKKVLANKLLPEKRTDPMRKLPIAIFQGLSLVLSRIDGITYDENAIDNNPPAKISY